MGEIDDLVDILKGIAKRRAVSAAFAFALDFVGFSGIASASNEALQTGLDVGDIREAYKIWQQLKRKQSKNDISRTLAIRGVPESIVDMLDA